MAARRRAVSPRFPWGTERRNRGLKYHDLACDFVREFPICTQLTIEAFGNWLVAQGKLVQAARNTAEWREFVDGRLRWRNRINGASTHSRMADTFTVVHLSRSVLEVKACDRALAETDNVRPIQLHARARRHTMSRYAQGIDWSQFPPATRQVTELLFDQINHLEEQARASQEMANKARSRLQQLLLPFPRYHAG